MPAVIAEGAETSQSEYYANSALEESLVRKAFYYRATGFAFTTLKYDYPGFPDSLVSLKREEISKLSPADHTRWTTSLTSDRKSVV